MAQDLSEQAEQLDLYQCAVATGLTVSFFTVLANSSTPDNEAQSSFRQLQEKICLVELLSGRAIWLKMGEWPSGRKGARHTIHELTVGTPELEVHRTLRLRMYNAKSHVSSTSLYLGLAKFSLHREMEDQTALRARMPCCAPSSIHSTFST